jgi:hypothetical protein
MTPLVIRMTIVGNATIWSVTIVILKILEVSFTIIIFYNTHRPLARYLFDSFKLSMTQVALANTVLFKNARENGPLIW